MSHLPVYPATERCDVCGGECCRWFAGFYTPEQVLPRLYEMLRAGLAAIDSYVRTSDQDEDGSGEILMVRPPHVNARDVSDESWGGTCIHHSRAGCSLDPSARPAQCLALQPGPLGDRCHGVTKGAIAALWDQPEHQDAVRAAWRRYGDNLN